MHTDLQSILTNVLANARMCRKSLNHAKKTKSHIQVLSCMIDYY